jgi:hypothetical protein
MEIQEESLKKNFDESERHSKVSHNCGTCWCQDVDTKEIGW